MGTAVGTQVFVRYGWRPAAALSLAWSGWMLFVILLRGPHCPRYRWFGYEGGFQIRKTKAMDVESEGRRAERSTIADGVEAAGDPELNYAKKEHSIRAEEPERAGEVRGMPKEGKEEQHVSEQEISRTI